MTNEEIAKSIRKATEEVRELVSESFEMEGWDWANIDDLLSQIESLTHYIKDKKEMNHG